MDFVLRRILPKLPVFKKVYFFMTRGKNRVISKAETLGRLSFCGFRVVATKEIDNSLYFIVQCDKNPSLVKNPSYGPIIKLKRIGLNGEPVYIRKLRTMHPYSEFLQEYVYKENNLDENGKFKNDFRVTEWGKVLRRFWLDELPQLINFIQGDLALVGVRALSEHYFSLYPDDLKKLRVKFKPGLFPPYYADLPKNFKEIIESERNYLAQKMKQPFVTDVKYFTKAVFNILFKNARSL
jgi:lipopolysaccharide/colanic/teichoic acid biosynthesis glycosyltransferase